MIEPYRTHFHSPNRQKNPAFFLDDDFQELSHSPTFPGEPTADRGWSEGFGQISSWTSKFQKLSVAWLVWKEQVAQIVGNSLEVQFQLESIEYATRACHTCFWVLSYYRRWPGYLGLSIFWLCDPGTICRFPGTICRVPGTICNYCRQMIWWLLWPHYVFFGFLIGPGAWK